MPYAEFHPGDFNFTDQNIRIVNASLSSGVSLSGIEEPIVTDGGGRVVADFMNGTLITPEENMHWRAVTAAMDGGASPVVVYLCDSRHQPVGARHHVPHSDGAPFDDESLYSGGGEPVATAKQNKSLRATDLRVAFAGEVPIRGGEWFSINHPTWGWRAYLVISVTPHTTAGQFNLTFRPPLREAVVIDEVVDFNRPRCTMHMVTDTGNPLSNGRTGTADISFVEDMRKPPE